MEVIVPNVTRCIDHVPKYLALKLLYNVYVTCFGASSELDTVFPNGV
jgi:hypothetical protein